MLSPHISHSANALLEATLPAPVSPPPPLPPTFAPRRAPTYRERDRDQIYNTLAPSSTSANTNPLPPPAQDGSPRDKHHRTPLYFNGVARLSRTGPLVVGRGPPNAALPPPHKQRGVPFSHPPEQTRR